MSGRSIDRVGDGPIDTYSPRSTKDDGACLEPEPAPPGQSVGRLAVRGGGYLIGREAIGMIIRLAGVVITVRAIGPAAYGIYSGAAAFVLFITTCAQMGAEVYLIRMPEEPDIHHYNQVFTFLVCVSLLVTIVAVGLTFLVGPWLRPHGVVLPLQVLLLSVPVNVLWAPAQARIEREFGYRRMGFLEIGGDLVLYGTAIPLALTGAGAWSLVIGYLAWQLWLLVGSYLISGLRPSWDWSIETSRKMTRHGLALSPANLLIRLSGLVNPLVVGMFAGATGVGSVAFAQRLVDTVGFAKRGAYRLGVVAMSKVGSHQTTRLRYAIEEGSMLQLLALAGPFAIVGIASHWVIPVIFGPQWAIIVPLYSLLALQTLLSASGLIQITVLISRGQNLKVAGMMAIETVVLALAAVVLVPRLGIDGFGVASLISLVSLVYTDRVVRRLAAFSYRLCLPFAVALAAPVAFPLFAPPFGFLLLMPLAGLLIMGQLRRELFRLISVVRSTLRSTN